MKPIFYEEENWKLKLKFVKYNTLLKKSLIEAWYFLMKPIAYFFTLEKEEKRYKKRVSKITEEQGIKWIAEDIALYLAKQRKGYKMSFLIANRFDTDYFSGYDSVRYLSTYYMKRKKTRMAYYKFTRDNEFQLKVLTELSKLKGIQIKEEIETFKYQPIYDYIKTCVVEYVG